jgi:hypothetical protein
MNQSNLTTRARRRAAEAVIRQAADLWAAGMRDLAPTTVLAVFLHSLTVDVELESPRFDHGSTSLWSSNPYGTLPLRPLDAWRNRVNSPGEELTRLAPHVSVERRESCSARLLDILSTAAEDWRLGDPESPNTEAITTALGRQLFDDGCFAWWDWRGVRP